MTWIPPLQLQTWVINVFAGDSNYFAIIALFVITSMAGYFRMNMVGMFLMVGVFLLMFSEFIPVSLVAFITIISGLLIGFWVSKIVK